MNDIEYDLDIKLDLSTQTKQNFYSDTPYLNRVVWDKTEIWKT